MSRVSLFSTATHNEKYSLVRAGLRQSTEIPKDGARGLMLSYKRTTIRDVRKEEEWSQNGKMEGGRNDVNDKWKGKMEGRREGGREGGRKGGREGGRNDVNDKWKGKMEGRREGGREGGRNDVKDKWKGKMEGGRE